MKSSTVARVSLVVLVTTLVFALGVYILYQLQAIIVWSVLALFLAVALDPLVNWLTRRRWRRTLAILTTYLLLLLVLAVVGTLILPALIEQTQQLISVLRTPGGFSQAVDKVAGPLGLGDLVSNWKPQLNALPGQIAGSLGSVSSLTSITTGTVSFVTGVLTVAVLGFFFVHDGARLAESGVGLLPEAQRPRARRILDHSATAISSYIRGNLTISVIAGVSVFVGMAILGIPFALPLAMLLGVLDLIPMVGAPLGAVPVVLAALTVSPIKALIILTYIVIYSQIESNVLNPLIYGRRDQLPALTVFLAFLIGSVLFGILGALVAIPAANIIRVLVREWRDSRRHDTPSSTEEAPDSSRRTAA
jgi:predicted PurR-regulated permease PerM